MSPHHEFALAYLTVPGVTPPEQTYMAAQTGYDYVSYRLFHLGVAGEPDIDPVSPQIIRETRNALRATGLRCLDIELMRILRTIRPSEFLPAFEAGAELGARQVICSAWTDVRNDRTFIVERFQEICEMARPFGLTVNLEFPAFSRLSSLNDCTEILELARAPNQGILIDTLYMHFNKTSLFLLERMPAEWINFMHLCDAADVYYTKDEMIHIARDARLYPGEGAIDFSAINYLFPNLPLAIELPNAARLKALGHEEHARRCIAAARTLLNPVTTN
ncbi:MAG: sugar phosphate isomerase/epimerase family protein [Paracoccus sp. (in: a-proteobacteria)]